MEEDEERTELEDLSLAGVHFGLLDGDPAPKEVLLPLPQLEEEEMARAPRDLH